jgi:hypothetical protein
MERGRGRGDGEREREREGDRERERGWREGEGEEGRQGEAVAEHVRWPPKKSEPQSLNPKPHTSHPAPKSLNARSYLNPMPYTLKP